MLRHVKADTGLSASTLTFAGSYNLLTNPLTYPQYEDSDDWLEIITRKGYSPKNWAPIEGHETDFFTKDFNRQLRRLSARFTLLYEKISSTDVSLTAFDSISDLRAKFNFETGVSSFLIQHRNLISFLADAYYELISRFPLSEFKLALRPDPEVEDWSTLFLSIISEHQSESLEAEVQDFIMNWMFRQSLEIKKLVTIVDDEL